MVDTNTDPTLIDFPIPANDDATKGIEMIVKLAAEACQAGLKQRKLVPAKKLILESDFIICSFIQ